jgi:HlyD family secretion protein
VTRPAKALLGLTVIITAAAATLSAPLWREFLTPPKAVIVPSTRARRGDVTFTVNANGAVQGGNSRMLAAPMTGSSQLVITELRQPGELVRKDDIVAKFDTTEESYKLREAEADLAEAEQQVIQATSEAQAKEEELNYELIKARGDLRQAELEVLRNPVKAGIVARQNDLALEGAKDRLAKLERDYPERKSAATASIAIQEAARQKAKVQAETAKKNIEMMTLKAPASGYINVERNSNQNFFFTGMTLPLFQVGDQVRAGMAVAQIPDLANWEASAQIAEQDRGHLTVGQPAEIRVIALPGKIFQGKITNLGGTTGSPWERRFECKLSLDNPVPELRPGMSTNIKITMETLKNVVWIPAQALFESDGRTFVYAKGAQGFSAKDVRLTRRSESQVVITGLQEGEEVALAAPDQKEDKKKPGGPGDAAKAVGK